MEFKDLIVARDISILDALSILNTTAKRSLFLTQDGRLIASISDGDIRRWILQQGKLSDPIYLLAKYNPMYIQEDDIDRARQIMMKEHIEALPVVDDKMRIINIIFLYSDNQPFESIDLPVVVMAGGKGTRLYPYTKILPKPLIPIGETPISEHIINHFRKNGCDNFFFILNYKKNMIKAYYHDIEKDYSIEFIDEDKPLGTGGGIGLLKNRIGSTFILTNCDSIITEDFGEIVRLHRENNNIITMICSLKNYSIPYGVVEIGENGSIKSIEEKPNMSFFTNTGTYIVEPQVINEIGDGMCIDFPDIINIVKDRGGKVGVYPINENSWLDMGQFDSMENMKEALSVQD